MKCKSSIHLISVSFAFDIALWCPKFWDFSGSPDAGGGYGVNPAEAAAVLCRASEKAFLGYFLVPGGACLPAA